MTVIETPAVTTDPASREAAWHLMGGAVSLAECNTVDDVLKRADLDWDANSAPIHTHLPHTDADGVEGTVEVPVPDRRAIYRSDNGLILGDVGKTFAPVQNRDFVEFGEAVRGEAGTEWDAGGSLKGGKVPFLSFKVPHGIQVAGVDQVDSYVLLANGHDGSTALRGSVIAYRISCGNQVASAFRGAAMRFSFRHVGDVSAKVEEARRALGFVATYMDEFEVIANSLADIDVDVAFYEDFVGELLPNDPAAGVRFNSTRARQRTALRQNWDASQTLDPDLRGTGWGALNLVTEVIDHGNLDARKSKKDKGERRFLSSLEGAGANLRGRAFDLLLGEAAAPGQVHQLAQARSVLDRAHAAKDEAPVLASVGGVL